ncbi:MAG: hypothetical protein ACTTH5_05240 [Wolinella sp.]
MRQEEPMKQSEIIEICYSSLFFLLALFTLLVMWLSNYVDNFGQLFMLVNKNHGIYASIFDMLAIFGILMGILFLRVRARENLARRYKLSIITMIALFALLLFLSMTAHSSSTNPHGFPLLDDFYTLRQNIAHFIDSYLGKRGLDMTFLTFFALLPMGAAIKNIDFNYEDRFGQLFYLLRPSANVVIITIFACMIQPFFKDHWWEYWELLITLLALALLAWLFYRQPKIFGFYERFNLTLLVACVLLMLFSSGLFQEGVNYYGTKKALYMLILLGWSARWMERITR